MTKLKSHAKWNGLLPRQRTTLEEWLFEERLSYKTALERARKELGFTGSISSLKRFYKRTAEERMLAGFVESERVMASVNNAPMKADELRDSGMKMAAQVFFRLVTEKPEELREWLPLAKLLAQCERNDSWRTVKEEENDIRRAALQFARVRFQYDTMGEALKALPELEDLKEAQEDAEMTVYEKNKRRNDVRRQMFGDVIPELLPENEEEEGNPEIIVRRFQEGQRRQQEEFAREYRERQREQAVEKAGKEGKNFTEENEVNEERAEGDGADENTGNESTDTVNEGKEDGIIAEANEGDREGEETREGTFTEANQENEETQDKANMAEAVEAKVRGGREACPEGENQPVAENVFVDEPRKLSAEERQREYKELMRRARGR